MANCTFTDVRRIISTDLQDSDITELITLADEEITNREVAKNLKLVSMLFTASYIAVRDPESRGIGEYREANTPNAWRELAEKVIASSERPAAPYTKSTSYKAVKEDT